MVNAVLTIRVDAALFPLTGLCHGNGDGWVEGTGSDQPSNSPASFPDPDNVATGTVIFRVLEPPVYCIAILLIRYKLVSRGCHGLQYPTFSPLSSIIRMSNNNRNNNNGDNTLPGPRQLFPRESLFTDTTSTRVSCRHRFVQRWEP